MSLGVFCYLFLPGDHLASLTICACFLWIRQINKWPFGFWGLYIYIVWVCLVFFTRLEFLSRQIRICIRDLETLSALPNKAFLFNSVFRLVDYDIVRVHAPFNNLQRPYLHE